VTTLIRQTDNLHSSIIYTSLFRYRDILYPGITYTTSLFRHKDNLYLGITHVTTLIRHKSNFYSRHHIFETTSLFLNVLKVAVCYTVLPAIRYNASGDMAQFSSTVT
jgi:hypothetical protein